MNIGEGEGIRVLLLVMWNDCEVLGFRYYYYHYYSTLEKHELIIFKAVRIVSQMMINGKRK